VRKRQQFYALQIPAQKTAGMTDFCAVGARMFSLQRRHPGNFVAREYPPSMQSDEIIRDLQSAQTSATLRAADSRSRDCGNDDFYFIINYLACHPGNFVVVK
jgi:hypothetical protein